MGLIGLFKRILRNHKIERKIATLYQEIYFITYRIELEDSQRSQIVLNLYKEIRELENQLEF